MKHHRINLFRLLLISLILPITVFSVEYELIHNKDLGAFVITKKNIADASNTSPVTGSDSVVAGNTFQVLDGTLYKGKPVFNVNFKQIQFANENDFYNAGDNHQLAPTVTKINEVADRMNESSFPIVIDMEQWIKDVDSENDTIANVAIDKYIFVMRTLKERRPSLKFGYYSVLPSRNYWASVSGNPDSLAKWEHVNKRLERLGVEVDAVFPSLYTFYDQTTTANAWKTYAEANIQQAKRYRVPIYTYLWPQYHDSNAELKYQYLAGPHWKNQLDILQPITDGIVVWGGWDFIGWSGGATWDDNAEWWKITKEFILKYSNTSN